VIVAGSRDPKDDGLVRRTIEMRGQGLASVEEEPMSEEAQPVEYVAGPMCYEHWRAIPVPGSGTGAVEIELFTDATITGDSPEGCGPYLLLNTIADSGKGGRPAIVLRLESNESPSTGFPDFDRFGETDTERYHGGAISDEVAALLSLELHMRVEVGRTIRHFWPGGDPRGRPSEFTGGVQPILLSGIHGPIIPQLAGQRCLNNLRLFQKLPLLEPRAASVLIRAARQYQNALWVSDGEPHLSWLMLVSAIETASQHWHHAEVSLVEVLRSVKPDLCEALEQAGGEALVERVAAEFGEGLRPTKKFIDFIIAFRPPEPPVRPPEFARCPWSKSQLSERLSVIYGHRSRALHDGKPFLQPMCDRPHGYGDGSGPPPEIPFGEAHQTLGGIWVKKDLPMLLHTFDYIVRGALLRWWESLVPQSAEEPVEPPG
jgi:hypothetical protein